LGMQMLVTLVSESAFIMRVVRPKQAVPVGSDKSAHSFNKLPGLLFPIFGNKCRGTTS
jgi:hypothetical protein